MKKLLYLLFAVTLIGCSSDEDESASDNIQIGKNLLVKSINLTNTSDGYSELLEYTYEGNKLVKVLSNYSNFIENYTSTETYNYIYTDNLISVINKYDSEQELLNQTFLEYNDFDRLISIKGNTDLDNSLVYNSDNTEVTLSNGNVLKFNSGNIIISYSYPDTNEIEQGKLTYDDKHSPFKNIIGNSEVYNLAIGFLGSRFNDFLFSGYVNNFVKLETSDNTEVSWTYDYNNEGYPRNTIVKSQGDVFVTAIIEYY